MATELRKNNSAAAPLRRDEHVKPPCILIVDDDPGQRSLLDSFLRTQGFETVTADSGEHALEALRAGHQT